MAKGQKKQPRKRKVRAPRKHPTRPVKRLRVFHATVDEHMEAAGRQHDVSCRPGCTACCYQLVSMSVLEGLAMLEEVFASPARTRRFVLQIIPVLKDQAKLLEVSSTVTVAEWFEMQVPCVFLGHDKMCSVYKSRPIACRTHAVVTPPENCHNDGKPGRSVGRLDTSEAVRHGITLTAREMQEVDLPPVYAPMPVALLLAYKLFSEGPEKYLAFLKGTIYADPIESAKFWARLELEGDGSEDERSGDSAVVGGRRPVRGPDDDPHEVEAAVRQGAGHSQSDQDLDQG